MKPILLSLICLSLFSSCANRAVYVYEYPKNVAVLPIKITQLGHVAKNVSEETIKSQNENWGYSFQESLYTYLLRQTERRSRGPVAIFQSLQKTNAILKENGITTIEDLYEKRPEDLARMLGVDAVIMTTLVNNKNFSDGVAYGLAAGRTVLGAIGKVPVGVPYFNSNDINMNCYLYDVTDSRLLWKTYRSGGTDLPSNVDGLVEYYSDWIARKFPYRS